jgi:hypothetical protein
MKKIMRLMVILTALALACPVLAQPGPGGGMGRGMGPMLYNPQTVATITGTVEKLEDLPSMGGGTGTGMRFRGVLLKTEKGSILVHLGPGWYLDEKKFALKVGDAVEATGSQVTLNNQPALIAREVKADGATQKLRDDQGLPMWRRRRGQGSAWEVGPAPDRDGHIFPASGDLDPDPWTLRFRLAGAPGPFRG